MSGPWLDIDSAPKDGREVLVFANDRYVDRIGHVGIPITAIAAYDPDDVRDPDLAYDWVVIGSGHAPCWVRATHWQPKPEDPV